MPRIWKVSHSDIDTDDHSILIENNLLAIGCLNRFEKGNTTIRDRFLAIDEGDYFYLVKSGNIILLGQFGNKIIPPLIVKNNHVSKNNRDIQLSSGIEGWLCREINIIKKVSYPNENVNCADKVRQLGYMPSGQTLVFEVPDNALSEFESDLLKPVFDFNLEDLKISTL